MLLYHHHYDWSEDTGKAHQHEVYGHRELFTHKHEDEHLGSWDDLRVDGGRDRRYPDAALDE